MKVRWLSLTFYFISIIFVVQTYAQKLPTIIDSDQAMKIAKQRAEYKAFITMTKDKLDQCIEESVVRPCDSEFVTCIDDAWVIQFSLKKECQGNYDDRIRVFMLISDQDGSVLSRFPEIAYFEDRNYCETDSECTFINTNSQESSCLNFLYSQLIEQTFEDRGQCHCFEEKCQLK